MPRTTPFYQQLLPLNQTQVWKKWSDFLVASKYQDSVTTEYYAIRNGVSVFDTSPLFKYRFCGTQATELLRRSMIRDATKCDVEQAQYTAWCDDRGFVIQDGVLSRICDNEFLLTAAEPCLRYFRQLARSMELDAACVEDVSEDYGILAIQGPLSIDVLSELTPDANALRYFRLTKTMIAGCEVILSRTGFTGDLGFEVWVKRNDAKHVFDAIFASGAGHNIIPIGSNALKIARVEAGLLLLDVDFESARFAWVDEQCETPIELGWDWMLKESANDDRDFIGRTSIETQLTQRTNRWTTVGLEIDWHSFEQVHRDRGIPTPKYEHYREETMSIYRRNEKPWDYAGYASSFLFSSLLKKPIAIAKLPNDLSEIGTEVEIEISVIRKPVNALARVTKMPFFNPKRKTKVLNAGGDR